MADAVLAALADGGVVEVDVAQVVPQILALTEHDRRHRKVEHIDQPPLGIVTGSAVCERSAICTFTSGWPSADVPYSRM